MNRSDPRGPRLLLRNQPMPDRSTHPGAACRNAPEGAWLPPMKGRMGRHRRGVRGLLVQAAVHGGFRVPPPPPHKRQPVRVGETRGDRARIVACGRMRRSRWAVPVAVFARAPSRGLRQGRSNMRPRTPEAQKPSLEIR